MKVHHLVCKEASKGGRRGFYMFGFLIWTHVCLYIIRLVIRIKTTRMDKRSNGHCTYTCFFLYLLSHSFDVCLFVGLFVCVLFGNCMQFTLPIHTYGCMYVCTFIRDWLFLGWLFWLGLISFLSFGLAQLETKLKWKQMDFVTAEVFSFFLFSKPFRTNNYSVSGAQAHLF